MSEQTETSPDEDGERGISVSRLGPTHGTTSRQITRVVRAALGDRPIRMISVAVVDDATIASLNERYTGDEHATDVLAFDLRDSGEDEQIEGEIVVSGETAGRQAKRLGGRASEELLRYAVHGTLHLMGYEDGTPAGQRRMRQAENRVLAGVKDRTSARRKQRQQRRTTGGE